MMGLKCFGPGSFKFGSPPSTTLGGSGLAKCTGQADLTRCGCTNQEVYQVFTLTGVQRRRKRAVEGFGEGTRMRT